MFHLELDSILTSSCTSHRTEEAPAADFAGAVAPRECNEAAVIDARHCECSQSRACPT